MATVGTLTLYSNKGGSSFTSVNHQYVRAASSAYKIYYKIPVTYNNDSVTKLTLKTTIYVTNNGGSKEDTVTARLYSSESSAQSYSATCISTATGSITSFNATAKTITFTFSNLNLTDSNLYVSFVTASDKSPYLELDIDGSSASVESENLCKLDVNIKVDNEWKYNGDSSIALFDLYLNNSTSPTIKSAQDINKYIPYGTKYKVVLVPQNDQYDFVIDAISGATISGANISGTITEDISINFKFQVKDDDPCVSVYNGTEFIEYVVHIYDTTNNFNKYIPYIHNGTEWVEYSG